MHLSTVKIPIDFGLDEPSALISVLIVKSRCLYYLYYFCITFSETIIVNSMTIAGYRSNRSPLLTELMFFHKSLMEISVNTRHRHRFTHLGRPILPVNHIDTSRCLQFRPYLGSRMRVSVTQCAARVGPSLLDSSILLLFCQPITYIFFYFLSLLLACTNSIAIDSMTIKYWFFFLSIDHQQSAISPYWLLWLPVIAQWL